MIKIDGLRRSYGNVRALDNLSLEVKKGEILGLLGPNGAGKSTTLRILTGYLKSDSGTVSVKGINVAEDPLQVKKMIGYLPESAPLYYDMLTFDYLMLMAEVRDIPKGKISGRIKELARLCGLQSVMHRPIGKLSKGFKQRVGLAFAMLSDPEILILDEPTNGLDPNQIVEIRSIIKDIGKTKTVIFSTHILSEAEATCDRIVIINKGKVVANGTADNLKEKLTGKIKLTCQLTNATKKDIQAAFKPLNDKAVLDIAKSDGPAKSLDAVFSSSADIREDVYGILKKQDWQLLRFEQERQSLENVFRELTREAQ